MSNRAISFLNEGMESLAFESIENEQIGLVSKRCPNLESFSFSMTGMGWDEMQFPFRNLKQLCIYNEKFQESERLKILVPQTLEKLVWEVKWKVTFNFSLSKNLKEASFRVDSHSKFEGICSETFIKLKSVKFNSICVDLEFPSAQSPMTQVLEHAENLEALFFNGTRLEKYPLLKRLTELELHNIGFPVKASFFDSFPSLKELTVYYSRGFELSNASSCLHQLQKLDYMYQKESFEDIEKIISAAVNLKKLILFDFESENQERNLNQFFSKLSDKLEELSLYSEKLNVSDLKHLPNSVKCVEFRFVEIEQIEELLQIPPNIVSLTEIPLTRNILLDPKLSKLIPGKHCFSVFGIDDWDEKVCEAILSFESKVEIGRFEKCEFLSLIFHS